MQVAEKKSEGLKREYSITIPANDIATQVESRLNEISRTTRFPGFRPGKAPVAMVKQRYGDSVRAEVLEKAINNSTRDLLSERKLRPAMQPKVELGEFSEGQDLTYTLSMEVLPEVKPIDMKNITIERITVDVADTEVDKAIEELSTMRKSTKKVDESRPSKMGDTLKIDFDGTVDGTPRPGMKSENFMLELGSKSFIDTFEEQLVGLKAGDEKVVTVTFPENYHAKELASQVAEFKVKIHELHEPAPAELNDEFAKGFGIESFDKLKEQIKSNIADTYKAAARTKSKRQLLDELAKAHTFEVPEGMVDFEFNSIWQQRGQQGPDPSEKGTTEEEIRAEYRDIAARRVRLGLLLAEIGQSQKIDITQEDLRQAVFAQARNYPGQERAVVEYYMKNQNAMETLRAPIYEDKVIDYLFELVNITEKPGTVDDLKSEEDMDDENETTSEETSESATKTKKKSSGKES